MKLKKILASILAICMVLGTMSFSVFAEEQTYVAKIGETEYSTFSEAMADANSKSGEVKVEIYGSVEFTDGMELKNGSYDAITFTGMAEGATITINQSAGGDYLEAHGKTVAFTNLTLAKANPAWSGNSGHMGNYFSIQGGTVTYTGCTFPNGACTSTGEATYVGCTFQNTSEYGLWVYDDALVTVEGGTIDSTKGIKVYSEGEESVTSTLTVKNATFTENITAKPAIAIGYAESITLIGNTYNNQTAEIELDSGSDADCEGIAFVAEDANGNDITSTLTVVDRSNSSAACGVLVDGKIYTTVTTAAADAKAGDTVTLLYDTEEEVTFAEGVTLDTNSHDAPNVEVEGDAPAPVYAATVNGVEHETLEDALAAAEAGDEIVLLADAAPVLTSQSAITKAAVIDLGGNTLTLKEDDLYFGTTTFKNGTIVVDPSVNASTAVFWMFENQTLTFDDVEIIATGVTGTYLIGINGGTGISVNLVNGSKITIENDTAASLTAVICDNGTGNSVTIEDSTIDVKNIDGRFYLGGTDGGITVTDSTINANGVKEGFYLRAGQMLSIEGTSTVDVVLNDTNGRYGINITDETATYTKADTATVNASDNKPASAPVYAATVNGTEHETLADALAVAEAGDEIVLLADAEGDITVPAGVIFNGNGFNVSGGIIADGDITFAGITKANSFNVNYVSTTINIGGGASLELTGTGRMVIGHGCIFNIEGNIADAKTANTADLTPSLIVAAGASFTGTNLTFNVTNAYIKFNNNSTSKNKAANGTFNFNITNSIWEQTGSLVFSAPTEGMDPTFNFNLKDSVLNSTSHLVFAVTKGEIVFDNSNINNENNKKQLENRSNLTIKNGSVVYASVATSENAKNPGTLTVDNATYIATGEFSGSDLGTGTLIIKKGANVSVGSIVDKANIVIDASGMTADETINFNANLSKFAGTVEVINNDALEAEIVDGKIVLAAKPVAQIGDTKFTSLQAAIDAAQNGETVEIYAGEFGAINISNKNITIKGAVGENGELLTTIKGGNPAITGHSFNGTIKDIKIVDAWKVMYAEPAGNVTVDNVYVTGATYGFHLVAYTTGITWTIQNSYMDLRWANSFGVYKGGYADIIVKGNEFVSTNPYYPDYGALHVNSFSPNVTVEENIFRENARIYIDDSVTDTSNINVSKNYHADGVDKAFAVDEDGGKTVAIYQYYTEIDENGNLSGLVELPKGTNSLAYTKEVDGYVRVWGQSENTNAAESYVLKLYAGDTLIATTKLNNIDSIIDGSQDSVTWNFFYPESDDEYWTTIWEENHPNADAQPTKVELYIDGTLVATTDAQMNGPDNLNPVVWSELGGVASFVAQIGDTKFTSLQTAIDAAQDGDTITLLANIEQADGVTITDKNLTIDLSDYTFKVTEGSSTNSRNFLINGNSVVAIKNGTLIAAGDINSGTYGTVRAEGTANVTLSDLKLYNYRGNGLNIKALTGTTVNISDTDVYSTYGGGIEAAGATIELTNVNVYQKGLWTAPYNSMAISVNGGGTVTVNSGIYSTEPLTAEDAYNQGSSHGSWAAGVLNSGGTLIINGGTFTNGNYGEDSLATAARGLILADTGANIQINGGTFNALKGIVDIQNNLGDASKNPTGTITGGTFSADPTNGYVTIKEGYAALADLNGNFVVGAKPTATVNNLGAMTIPAGDYMIYGSGDDSVDMPLSFVMQFIADQTEADMQASPYAEWYGDFVLSFTGLENDSFVADGCYLAGHYGPFGWVKVPVDGMEIEEGVRYPVMLGVGMGQKYDYICSGVQDFKCALYLTPEIIEANPNIKVNLELAVVDNSKGSDAATEALMNGENTYKVTDYTYDADDFEIKNPAGKVAYRAYVNDSEDREGVQVDLANVYAKESLVIKLLDAEGNLLTTTTYKAGAIEKDSLTCNIVLWGRASGSWDTVVTAEKFTNLNIPATIEVWSDGVLVDTFENALGAGTNVDETEEYIALDCVTKLIEFTTMTTSLDSSLALNIYLNSSDLTGTDYYAVVEHTKATGKVVKTTIPYAEWKTVGKEKVISYTGIAAKEMADKIKITVYNADDTQASEAYETSLRDYAIGMLNYITDNNLESLYSWRPALVDMLNYGAAAQQMFNYNTENLANADTDAFQQYASDDYTVNRDGCSAEGSAHEITLTLEDMIKLNAYFKNVTEGMYATYSYTTHAGTEINETVDYASFVTKSSKFGVPVGIAIADADALVTVTMFNSDNTEAGKVVYSVNGYLRGMIDLGETDDLYPALAKFAASAKTAFAEKN